MKLLIPILSAALVTLTTQVQAQNSDPASDVLEAQKQAQKQAQEQMEQAQKQIVEAQKEAAKAQKEADKQIKDAQKQIEKQVITIQSGNGVDTAGAFSGGGGAGAGVGVGGMSSGFRGAGGGIDIGNGMAISGLRNRYRASSPASSGPMVIHTSPLDPKTQANLGEDLTVMRRILDKATDENTSSEKRTVTAMGIDVFVAPGEASAKSLYLEDYGAIFFLNVNFPLVASNQTETKPKSATNSSEWEEAKKEVVGQSEDVDEANSGETFSEEKVTKLKERLIKALKNASNIRGFKSPSESVTICVQGPTADGKTQRHTITIAPPAQIRASSGNGSTSVYRSVSKSMSISSSSGKTVLTLKASKADIDAYASGKLSQEEFTKKVSITPYTDSSNEASVSASSFPVEMNVDIATN
jgi:hypothetical protein